MLLQKKEAFMARTYIPSQVIETHRLAKYMTRYQSALRAAIVAVDPDFGAIFDAMLTAVLAFDAIAVELYPLED
jgi:hypothetical protein